MLLDLVPAAVALVLLLITMLSHRTDGIAVLWLHRQPIDTMGETYLFSMHVVRFLLLTFVAAPLLVLGVSVGWCAACSRLSGWQWQRAWPHGRR